MKNDSNLIIRSEEVTIDMHICAALSESRSSGEIYFAAIAPDMELTVITLDEAPDILPCFDEDEPVCPAWLQGHRPVGRIQRIPASALCV